MNGFLAGVVRRGAGIASPIAIRPAAGPQWAPTADPVEPRAVSSETEGGRVEANAGVPERRQAGSAEERSPVRASVSSEVREGPNAISPDRAATEAVVKLPVTRRQETVYAAMNRPRDLPEPSVNAVRGTEKKSVPPVALPPVRAASIEPSEAVSARRVDERRETEKASAIEPRALASAAPTVEKRVVTEPRNIQVKIGKVEIRSTQAPQAAPAMRPVAKGGFGDLALARSYLDRGRW